MLVVEGMVADLDMVSRYGTKVRNFSSRSGANANPDTLRLVLNGLVVLM